MARAVARRTAAHFDWPRVDGETKAVDFGRAVRRTRPGRARTFFAISPKARLEEKFSGTCAGDASCRRNHAGVFACAGFEKWKSAGGRKKIQNVDGEKFVGGLRGETEASFQSKPFCDERFAEIWRGDLIYAVNVVAFSCQPNILPPLMRPTISGGTSRSQEASPDWIFESTNGGNSER